MLQTSQQWLRTLFPSWRLFENTGEIARLYYRVGTSSENLGEWQRRLPQIENSHFLLRLFFNPSATKEHAIQNRLYHFLYDIEAAPTQIEELITYQFIQGVLESALKSNDWYQFQIRSFDQKSGQETELVTSATHQVRL